MSASDELFQELKSRGFKRRESTKVVTQSDKVKELIRRSLLPRWWQHGVCHKDDVEKDALDAGLQGRTSVQLGAGIGGKDGMMLFIDTQGNVTLDKDNVLNCLNRLGNDRFEEWLEAQGISADEFRTWFEQLP